ncbi:MAG: hypothetical protein ABJC61_09100 [Acidobacteriota bacterium]
MPETDLAEIAASAERRWQDRTLPFMVRMLGGLTIFFLAASFIQLVYLHSRIEKAPILPNSVLVPPASAARGLTELNTASVLLESHVVALRYHQANIFLMARVWTNYLGFVTGMTLALVGATFILGKLRMSSTSLEGRMDSAAVSLKTASPGITLAVLGVVLMMTTIVVQHPIETKDVPVYLGPRVQPQENLMPPAAGTAAPSLTTTREAGK